MNQSIFSILSTYKPTQDITPEENYSTELLVYLLNNSLHRKSPLFSLFMAKLTNQPISIKNYSHFTTIISSKNYLRKQLRITQNEP